MIVVCGLPSSGNRLVREHLQRGAGEERVIIWHGDNESPWRDDPDERVVLVVPVRQEPMRLKSVARREADPKEGVLPQVRPKVMIRNVVALQQRHQAPLHTVVYEDLVEAPDETMQDLFRKVELPWVPWPTTPGAHPWEGSVFDANARY